MESRPAQATRRREKALGGEETAEPARGRKDQSGEGSAASSGTEEEGGSAAEPVHRVFKPHSDSGCKGQTIEYNPEDGERCSQ